MKPVPSRHGQEAFIVAKAHLRQPVDPIGGRGAGPAQGFSGDRMTQGQPPGVQSLSVNALYGAPSIGGVTHERVFEVLQMNPDLMGAPGMQLAMQP